MTAANRATNEIGRVREIVRYPVKSMAGVPAESAFLGWHGLAGDRRFAFRRLGNDTGFPWLSATRVFEMLLYQPVGLDETSGQPLPTHVRTPAGRELRPVLHELARFGARLIGPPPPDALEDGWLLGALDLALSPLCRGSRIAFRIGDEEASLVDCTATPGIAEDYDVLVETDATGFYHLVVNRRLDGVRIEGDVAALEQLLDGFASSPLPASPLPA